MPLCSTFKALCQVYVFLGPLYSSVFRSVQWENEGIMRLHSSPRGKSPTHSLGGMFSFLRPEPIWGCDASQPPPHANTLSHTHTPLDSQWVGWHCHIVWGLGSNVPGAPMVRPWWEPQPLSPPEGPLWPLLDQCSLKPQSVTPARGPGFPRSQVAQSLSRKLFMFS